MSGPNLTTLELLELVWRARHQPAPMQIEAHDELGKRITALEAEAVKVKPLQETLGDKQMRLDAVHEQNMEILRDRDGWRARAQVAESGKPGPRYYQRCPGCSTVAAGLTDLITCPVCSERQTGIAPQMQPISAERYAQEIAGFNRALEEERDELVRHQSASIAYRGQLAAKNVVLHHRLKNLVDQVRKINPVDEFGQHMTSNAAYLKGVQLVEVTGDAALKEIEDQVLELWLPRIHNAVNNLLAKEYGGNAGIFFTLPGIRSAITGEPIEAPQEVE